jgi:hypothetical protein
METCSARLALQSKKNRFTFVKKKKKLPVACSLRRMETCSARLASQSEQPITLL